MLINFKFNEKNMYYYDFIFERCKWDYVRIFKVYRLLFVYYSVFCLWGVDEIEVINKNLI